MRIEPRPCAQGTALQGRAPRIIRPWCFPRGAQTLTWALPSGFTVDDFKLTEPNEKIIKIVRLSIDLQMLRWRVIERFTLRMWLPRAPAFRQTCRGQFRVHFPSGPGTEFQPQRWWSQKMTSPWKWGWRMKMLFQPYLDIINCPNPPSQFHDLFYYLFIYLWLH